MKSGTIVVGLAAVITAAGIGYAFIRDRQVASAQEGATPRASSAELASDDIPGVDDVAATPEKFKGEILLRGVVAGVNQAEGVFGVIDVREYEACGVVTCAANTLPVRSAGKLPAVKTVVQITGRIVRAEKGLLIEATRVEVQP